MTQAILLEILDQNRASFWAAFSKITPENAGQKLNGDTASVGFIYRHVGEAINRLGTMLGVPTDVQPTTMGQPDNGQGDDLDASRELAERGFAMLENYVKTTPEPAWMEMIDAKFFGTISPARLFARVLFHNSYHVGQVELALKRGQV